MDDEQTSSLASADLDELIVCAKSQRLALGQLYEHYYPEVYRYCLRRLLVRTVAEDVISDVFLQIASHVRSFPGRTETDFRRWLFRIATNEINTWIRQTRRREALWKEAVRDGRLNDKSGAVPGDRPCCEAIIKLVRSAVLTASVVEPEQSETDCRPIQRSALSTRSPQVIK